MPTYRIAINSNPQLQNGRNVRAIRVSNRPYTACVVATVTQKTVDDVARGLADHEALVAELRPLCEARLAEWWMSHAEVEAAHQRRADVWYGVLIPAERAKRSSSRSPLVESEKNEVRAELIAQGYEDPYQHPQFLYLEMARRLHAAERAIAHIKAQDLKAGQQLVVSWHGTIPTARTALNSSNCKHYRARFYTTEVRTDIEIV